jgi:sulfur carrier protein
MEVFINNQSVSVSGPVSLQSILAQQQLSDKKGIAVAVNNAIVSRYDWDSYTLHPSDNITIIRATQGG